MGSMLKFDSDRRELVRERRQARMERKALRREDRERKRTTTTATPIPTASMTATLSPTQRAAERQVREQLDRIVGHALDRHDRRAATVSPAAPAAPIAQDIAAPRPGPARVAAASPGTPATGPLGADEQLAVDGATANRERRVSRRDRDLAAFRERRQHAADAAREEARARIARAGELASVADALAALGHPAAGPWAAEREQLERALATGRFSEVGAEARRAVWAIARDAARTSPRATRDADLALAACVAYAIIARAPRTALRSCQRARPTPRVRPAARRAFWR
ncbi:MAG: hypothetical protein ABSH51_32110 [Solirubrobacteraceae bacterium]|jgi:hypothetical protein